MVLVQNIEIIRLDSMYIDTAINRRIDQAKVAELRLQIAVNFDPALFASMKVQKLGEKYRIPCGQHRFSALMLLPMPPTTLTLL